MSRFRAAAWPKHLVFSGLITAGLLLGLFLLSTLIDNQSLVSQTRIQGIACVGLFFMVLGLAGLARAFPHLHFLTHWPRSTIGIFLLTYLLPALVILIPGWIIEQNLRPWESSRDSLFPVILLQSLILFCILLLWEIHPPFLTAIHMEDIIIGGLGGMGLGLFSTYLLSIFEPIDPGLVFIQLSEKMKIAQVLGAVFIIPLAEEIFFRGILLERWETKLGFAKAVLFSSLMFVIIQPRPVLWLPAFLFSLCAVFLMRKHRSLLPAFIAHLTYNLIMIQISWEWLL